MWTTAATDSRHTGLKWTSAQPYCAHFTLLRARFRPWPRGTTAFVCLLHPQAILDMIRIVTAIVLLALGAYMFNRDTTRLVLVPIERMVQTVRSISSLCSFAARYLPSTSI